MERLSIVYDQSFANAEPLRGSQMVWAESDEWMKAE